ncbi:MAG TPA: PadR family transcriptional regulator [Anaerolineaceae bacterium]|jgi:DNA-binding PadR family transcriptional regulator|nr:PadR family transcriptional regulator [Anaerolineaceae bacterium]
MDKSIQDALPLTETTLFILLSLSEEPRHGYAIMKSVLQLSKGRINLTAGTLYGAIKRLLGQDWIERIDDGDLVIDNPGLPRKAYHLTRRGRAILQAEVQRLQSVMQAVNLQVREERS